MIDVKEIVKEDIEAIAMLEQEIFPDPWSANSIAETCEQNHACILGAKKNGKLVGYVIFYYVLDEGEIARIAVAPSSRRQGAAQAVFDKLLLFCEENSVTRILLDVRVSNEGAIAFYKKMGFSEDGIRKNFYENPKEHALLMSMDIAR